MGGGQGGQNWATRGQIEFIFKVFLRPYISRIRMFAIEILLAGVFFVAILDPPLLFRLEGTKKSKFMLFKVMLDLLLIF